MRALVVYESMYGNTHDVANHIGEGLQPAFDVTIVSVGDASTEMVAASDLLVCGGPTHVHGMSRPSTRQAATAAVAKEGSDLSLDPAANGPGLRDWFDEMSRGKAARAAAAFDTRIDAPSAFTGRASRGIARSLRHHGFRLVVEPESFLVDKASHLCEGEAERAATWGATLATAAMTMVGATG